MARFEAFIFDFDGTIADTFQAFVNIINKVLVPTFNIEPVSETEAIKLRSRDPRELFTSHGISMLKLPFIVARARSELTSMITEIHPQKGIVEALEKLRTPGFRLGICTSNSKSNVTAFLRNNNMTGIFEFIYTGKHLFGKHKIIQKLLREQKLQKETTMFVGDEIRDIEAAHNAGLKVIAVTWGFNSREAFTNVVPDHMIDTPEQLLTLV